MVFNSGRASEKQLRLAVAKAEHRLAVRRIVAQYMRQKIELNKKIDECKRALSAKHDLEFLIAYLKGQLKVMKYMEDNDYVQKRVREMTEELALRTAELEIKTKEFSTLEEFFAQGSAVDSI